jgi:Ran GTPase-activating protein (RanGAP) involved in mRNA processing and transport
MILLEKFQKNAVTYIVLALFGYFSTVSAADTAEMASRFSGSENSSKSDNMSSSECAFSFETSPRIETSPRDRFDDKTIIKISSRQDINDFIDSDVDLKKIQQIIVLDLNKDNAVSIMNYLNLNSKSLLNLKKLTLKNLPLEHDNAANLAVILNNSKNLKELRIESNQLYGDGFKKLKINNRLNLQKLEIINNAFDDAILKNLKPLFVRSDKLKYISLRGSHFEVFNSNHWSVIVKQLSDLIYLDLSFTNIDADRLESILSKTLNLKHLDLSGNNFCKITSNKTDTLKSVFRNLEVLILSGTMIDASSIFTLLNLICKSANIKTLDLSNNNIGDQGIHLIALNFSVSLEKLIIKNNEFKNHALLYLKQNIEKFEKLTNLDISENNLFGGMNDIKDIIIRRDCSLRVLNLSKTELGDSDLRIIAQNFDIFNSLNSLYIEYNNFTAAGYNCLLKLSDTRINLKTLSIHSDIIPKDKLEEISNILSSNLKGCRIMYTGFVGQI